MIWTSTKANSCIVHANFYYNLNKLFSATLKTYTYLTKNSFRPGAKYVLNMLLRQSSMSEQATERKLDVRWEVPKTTCNFPLPTTAFAIYFFDKMCANVKSGYCTSGIWLPLSTIAFFVFKLRNFSTNSEVCLAKASLFLVPRQDRTSSPQSNA